MKDAARKVASRAAAGADGSVMAAVVGATTKTTTSFTDATAALYELGGSARGAEAAAGQGPMWKQIQEGARLE